MKSWGSQDPPSCQSLGCRRLAVSDQLQLVASEVWDAG